MSVYKYIYEMTQSGPATSVSSRSNSSPAICINYWRWCRCGCPRWLIKSERGHVWRCVKFICHLHWFIPWTWCWIRTIFTTIHKLTSLHEQKRDRTWIIRWWNHCIQFYHCKHYNQVVWVWVTGQFSTGQKGLGLTCKHVFFVYFYFLQINDNKIVYLFSE